MEADRHRHGRRERAGQHDRDLPTAQPD